MKSVVIGRSRLKKRITSKMPSEEDFEEAKERVNSVFADIGITHEEHPFDSPVAPRPCFKGFDYKSCFEHCATCGWDIGYHSGIRIEEGVMHFGEVAMTDSEFDEITSLVDAMSGKKVRRWDVVLMETQYEGQDVILAAFVPSFVALQAMYGNKETE